MANFIKGIKAFKDGFVEGVNSTETEKQKEEVKHLKELEKILILSGIVNKEYILHEMKCTVGEEFLDKQLAIQKAYFEMRQHLYNLGYDGILNAKMESTVTLGQQRDNQRIPYYSVMLYGDAFSYV